MNIRQPQKELAPQPVLEVINGFQCQSCQFISRNRRVIRVHCNKVHYQKRLPDNQLFTAVRLQTWFKGGGKEQYWVVNKGQIVEAIEAEGSITISIKISIILLIIYRVPGSE